MEVLNLISPFEFYINIPLVDILDVYDMMFNMIRFIFILMFIAICLGKLTTIPVAISWGELWGMLSCII